MTGVLVAQVLLPLILWHLSRRWRGRVDNLASGLTLLPVFGTILLVVIVAPQMLPISKDSDEPLLGGLALIAILLAMCSAIMLGLWLFNRTAHALSPPKTSIMREAARFVFCCAIATSMALGWMVPFFLVGNPSAGSVLAGLAGLLGAVPIVLGAWEHAPTH